MSKPDDTERVLEDGARILMRPIRPSDKEAIAAGFERLSPTSRYRRFFAPLTRLSAADLRYLTEIDHRDHEAIIAFDERGDPVGVARYVRTDRPDSAEVAVTVADDWQNRGVATAMLERLVERAREEGIDYFVALILAENEEAIELFRQLSEGDAEPRRSASGHLELLIELPEEGRLSGTGLGRALRGAASGEVPINPWRVLKRRVRDIAESRQ